MHSSCSRRRSCPELLHGSISFCLCFTNILSVGLYSSSSHVRGPVSILLARTSSGLGLSRKVPLGVVVILVKFSSMLTSLGCLGSEMSPHGSTAPVSWLRFHRVMGYLSVRWNGTRCCGMSTGCQGA